MTNEEICADIDRDVALAKEAQRQAQIEALTACEIGRSAELPLSTAVGLRDCGYVEPDMKLTPRGMELLLRLRTERASTRWEALRDVGSGDQEIAMLEWNRHATAHADFIRSLLPVDR